MFQKRLNLIETELVTHSESSFASVYYLRVKTANLQSRPPLQLTVVPPPLLDAFPKTIYEILSNITANAIRESGYSTGTHVNSGSLDKLQRTVQFIRRGDWLCVGNLCQSDGDSNSVESQLDYCFDYASGTSMISLNGFKLTINFSSDILAQNGSGMKDIAMINLFISSMGLFHRINAVYAKRFGVAPPARACVAIDLPPGVHVRIEVIAYSCGPRKSMHVQSLSYWAPANIGPYSQAVTVRIQQCLKFF
jgi:diphthine-ammonia ligase